MLIPGKLHPCASMVHVATELARTKLLISSSAAMVTGRDNIGLVMKRLAKLQMPKVTWLWFLYMWASLIYNIVLMSIEKREFIYN